VRTSFSLTGDAQQRGFTPTTGAGGKDVPVEDPSENPIDLPNIRAGNE
jgi:hypothetical protein